MKKVFAYLSPYSLQMAGGLAIKLSATFCELFLPMILGYIINKIVPRENIALIFLWGGVMFVFAGLAFAGNVIANRMASRVARNTTERIREDLFRKISYLSSSQAEQVTLPSLISRSTSDTYNVHQMLGMIQRLGVRAPIMLVGGLILAFFLDVSLTCVMIVLLPVIAFVVVVISGKGIPMYRAVQESNDRFVRLMREDIAGIRVIKALSRERLEREKFDAINREVVERDQRAGVLMNAMNPGVGFLLNLGLVLILAAGAQRVHAGKMEAGTILSFMSYVTMILNSIMMLNRMITVLSKASASANRIVEVLELPEDLLTVPEKENDPKKEKPSDTLLEFDHVSFGYGEGGDILSDLTFSIKKGETLGIIGETGSGKSTILQLLMRFYDTRQGVVRVEGRDVRAFPKEELRRKFGTVFQNDIIFQDTLRENIVLGATERRTKTEGTHCQSAGGGTGNFGSGRFLERAGLQNRCQPSKRNPGMVSRHHDRHHCPESQFHFTLQQNHCDGAGADDWNGNTRGIDGFVPHLSGDPRIPDGKGGEIICRQSIGHPGQTELRIMTITL